MHLLSNATEASGDDFKFEQLNIFIRFLLYSNQRSKLKPDSNEINRKKIYEESFKLERKSNLITYD